MQLWVIAASNAASTRNLPKTLSQPISDQRKANLPEAYRQYDYAWGARATSKQNTDRFERMRAGDGCLFYTERPGEGEKAYSWFGRIVGEVRSTQVAEALWDLPDFELVFFLENPRPIRIKPPTLGQAFQKYRSNYFSGAPKRFERIDQSVVDGIVADFGTLDVWIDTYSPSSLDPEADFLEIVRRYLNDGTVFLSTEKGARYCIESVGDNECKTRRLDAGTVETCRVADLENSIQLLRENDGRCPCDPTFNSVAAIRSTVLQANPLALDLDKHVVDVSSLADAAKVFCDLLSNLRVDPNTGTTQLYKPAMMACVIEAIDSGLLTENRIEYDWIVPHFVKKMMWLGNPVDEPKTCMAFILLRDDLFWMLCHRDVNDQIDAAHDGPVAVRSKISHAVLKDTFWQMLQMAPFRTKCLMALAEKWWPEKVAGVRLPFWWVSQGQTYAQETEGGFMWAPKARDGVTQHYWTNVSKVRKDDIIFNYANGLKGVSIARSDGYEAEKPGALADHTWEAEGWRADIECYAFAEPVPVARFGARFAAVNRKYSPINSQGKANQGYLFDLTAREVRILLDCIDASDLPEEILDRFKLVAKGGDGMAPSDSNLGKIAQWIGNKGFVFSLKDIMNYYCCLRTKPFVILAGISGTGKSRLVRLFAEAMGATEENGQFKMIPVRPDWNDNSDLIGYFDLEDRFRPGALVSKVLESHANPEKPYFVCLDEMNLAKVEHYFSDFLSIVESRRRDPVSGKVVTDLLLNKNQLDRMVDVDLSESAKLALEEIKANGTGIGLPANMYVVGTVNMDETTHPFSRKVLDRASTIEFNDIDLLKGMGEPGEEVEIADHNSDFLKSKYLTMRDVLDDDPDSAKATAQQIDELNAKLRDAGCEVGYRVRDEAAFYMKYAAEAGLSAEEAFGFVVLQKVLPRVQGSSLQIQRLLEKLRLEYFKESADIDSEDIDFIEKLQAKVDQASPLKKKIATMLIRYIDDGFTSYWAS